MNKGRLIKIDEVTRLCAMSRATLYRLLASNNFPPQVSVTGAVLLHGMRPIFINGLMRGHQKKRNNVDIE